MKKILVMVLLSLLSVAVFAADYEVGQECKTDGVVVLATAKNVGAFSGARINLVCLEGRLAYARMEGLDKKGCMQVIARRDGTDTPMTAKTPEGDSLCANKD